MLRTYNGAKIEDSVTFGKDLTKSRFFRTRSFPSRQKVLKAWWGLEISDAETELSSRPNRVVTMWCVSETRQLMFSS